MYFITNWRDVPVKYRNLTVNVRCVRLYFPEYLHSIFNIILQTNTQKSVVQHRNQTTADMFSPSIHLKRWNHPEFHMKVWECFHFLDRLALAAGRSCDRLAGGFPAWRLWSISSIRQTSLQSLLLKARADIQSHIQCGQRAVSGECFYFEALRSKWKVPTLRL